MKEFWIEIDPNSPEKEKLLKISNENSDAIVEGSKVALRSAGTLIQILDVFNEDSIKELKRESQKVALKVYVTGKEDEDIAVKAAELLTDYIIIDCLDWRVIPLENLLARTCSKSKLIAQVSTAQEAQLVLETLEIGTSGVLLKTGSADEIIKTRAIINKQTPLMELIVAKIATVKQIGTGARVCVDTCDLMSPGEGLLVGSQSSGLFLVEAEVHENPYVASRPFRVNAGSLSMYTLGSMQSTRYLSELKAGDEVTIVDRQGKARQVNVGRTKTEFRPLLLIEAQVGELKIKTVLQNAETIRLVTPGGDSKPITSLKSGDEVLVYLAAKGGRHFGVSVPEERVIEH